MRQRYTDRERAAYHEAGHAVVAIKVGVPVSRVRIGDAAGGLCEIPAHRARSKVHADLAGMVVDLAGGIAEQLLTGVPSSGSGMDRQHAATKAAALASSGLQADELHRRALGVAGLKVLTSLPEIERVAAALVEHGTLTGKAVWRLMYAT